MAHLSLDGEPLVCTFFMKREKIVEPSLFSEVNLPKEILVEEMMSIHNYLARLQKVGNRELNNSLIRDLDLSSDLKIHLTLFRFCWFYPYSLSVGSKARNYLGQSKINKK